MTHVSADRIRETSSSEDDDDFVLAGAITNFRAFSTVMSNADTCFYTAVLESGGWEVGIGTKITGGLERTTVIIGSNGTSKVSFGPGAKDVFLGIPADYIVQLGPLGNLIKALEFAGAASVASATTTDIGAAASNYVSITGTTTITGLGTKVSGAIRWAKFTGALTLTHNATSLILPGGVNITTAAGDTAIFVSEGSGNWRCLSYQKANGKAVVQVAGGDATQNVGYLNIPQESKSAAYTTVLSDAGKHIFHPAADTTARTWTIDSNANVAYPVGTAITFINQNAGGVITIAITSDTMRLAGAGTTGNRTLAANGVATAIKVASTEWIISGTGLT